VELSPYTPSLSPSRARALLSGFIRGSGEARGWLHRCLSLIGPQRALSTNHKRPRSACLAFTPDIVSATCAVLRSAVIVHTDLRPRRVIGQYWLRISFYDNASVWKSHSTGQDEYAENGS